jgi:hypothetical protein
LGRVRREALQQSFPPLHPYPNKTNTQPNAHLVAAVEHDHVLAERVAQVLGRLRLARPRRPRRRAAEEHAQGLAQRDVAHVGQRRDHEALLDAEVLVAVLEVDVADGDYDRAALLAPVEADLLEPVKVGRVADLWLGVFVLLFEGCVVGGSGCEGVCFVETHVDKTKQIRKLSRLHPSEKPTNPATAANQPYA